MTTDTTRAARTFWALGDYDRIARLVRGLGAQLVDAARIQPGQRVLDVAAGTGNATVAAQRAGAEVVATDVTPELIEIGRCATGPDVEWVTADAEQLPFPDGSFDVVLSCIGAMFAADQAAAAGELLRVCCPGGTVAMANWTPDGGAGRFFELLAQHVPLAGPRPTAWGEPDHVTALLGDGVASLRTEQRAVRLDFTGSPEELCAVYRESFSPVVAARTALAGQPERLAALDRDMLGLLTAESRAATSSATCWCWPNVRSRHP
jgi:SAM-dependent methyltransferase